MRGRHLRLRRNGGVLVSAKGEFSDTYTCQECGVVEAYEKAYEVGGIVSSKLVCRLCAKKEEGEL